MLMLPSWPRFLQFVISFRHRIYTIMWPRFRQSYINFRHHIYTLMWPRSRQFAINFRHRIYTIMWPKFRQLYINLSHHIYTIMWPRFRQFYIGFLHRTYKIARRHSDGTAPVISPTCMLMKAYARDRVYGLLANKGRQGRTELPHPRLHRGRRHRADTRSRQALGPAG